MERLIALTDQYHDRLEVFDLGTGEISEKTRVWSYQLPVRGLAGMQHCRSALYGEVALMACGKNYACMVSYPEGKLLWETTQTGDNPHAIELLPCGIIAVASSSGDCVRFFDAGSADCLDQKYLRAAHGVLWDDKRGLLWAAGYDKLAAYTVQYQNGRLSVTEQESRSVCIPARGAHELIKHYEGDDSLVLTTYKYVFKFDINSSEFTDISGGFPNPDDIKGITFFEGGDAAVLRPDGLHRPWTSTTVELLKKTENGYETLALHSDIGHYYKCREWSGKIR